MKNFNQKVISGFAWEASTRLIVQIASWVSTIWVARLLTANDYGLVAIAGIFTSLFLTLSGMGLGRALVNKKELTTDDMANVFWTTTILSLCFYILLYCAAPYIADHYQRQELKLVIRFAGIMIIVSPLSIVPRALTMRQLHFKAVALIAMAAHIFVIITTLSMAFAGFGYWSLVVATVGAEIFNLLSYTLVARYWPTLPRNIRTVLPLYAFGGSVFMARLVGYLNTSSSVLFVSHFLGTIAAGNLQMAKMLAKIPMTKIGQVFNKITFPAFSRIQKNTSKAKRAFLAIHSYMFMIIAPMFIGIGLTAEQLIPLLMGEKWSSIIVPIQILCAMNLISGSAMIIPNVLEGIGDPRASFKYQLVTLFIVPPAMLIGLQWGLNGFLVAWMLALPIPYAYVIRIIFSRLNITIIEFARSISVTLICSILMIGAVWLVDIIFTNEAIASIEILLLKIVCGVFSYSLGYLILGKSELIRLFTLLRKKSL